jgi:SAM-dependent methyltransferase
MVDASARETAATRVGPRTQAAFGFEWLRYPVTTPEEDRVTFFGLTGIEPSFYEAVEFSDFLVEPPSSGQLAAATTTRLHDKRVLEAGCGMGKYVRVASELGTELAVGLDASDAVDRAVTTTERRPNVLIVQGDIFHPPLHGGFDFAYSVGVLHHTPAPRRAFESVASLVRPGGELAVWLYPHANQTAPYLLEIWHERLLRPMTSRLPHRMLERLCVGLGKLTVVKTRLRERGGMVRNGVARLLSAVAVGEHLDPGIAAFLNFDWYSPPHRSRHTEAELTEWYTRAGFDEPRMLPLPVSAIGRAGDGSRQPDSPPRD